MRALIILFNELFQGLAFVLLIYVGAFLPIYYSTNRIKGTPPAEMFGGGSDFWL